MCLCGGVAWNALPRPRRREVFYWSSSIHGLKITGKIRDFEALVRENKWKIFKIQNIGAICQAQDPACPRATRMGPPVNPPAGKEKLPMPTVDDSSDEEAGPAPPPVAKKRKTLEFQQLFLDNLPSATAYEKSYMHMAEVSHVRFTKTNFLITASADGHIKFWKKKPKEVEFVKRFFAHVLFPSPCSPAPQPQTLQRTLLVGCFHPH